MSVKDVCQFFWAQEQKHSLLSDKNQETWLPLRFVLYYFITKEIGVFEKSPSEKKTVISKITSSLTLFFHFLLHNPWLSPRRKTVLVPADRKVNNIDIYSDEIMRKEKDDLVILDTYSKKYRIPGSYSFDFPHHVVSLVASFLTKFSFFYTKEDNDAVRSAMADFSAQFNIPLAKIQKLHAKQKFVFRTMEKTYYSFFRMRSFRKLYLVGSYSRMDIISAAKRAGIQVTEIQHGVITTYHLGYSFPGHPKLKFFPDEIQCHGKFWFERTNMPSDVKFSVAPANFIKKLAEMKGTSKNKNEVVFNSQGVIGSQIFHFAAEVARLCPELTVIFRLHPTEREEKYRALMEKLNVPANFSISHKTPNIFTVLSQAEYVAGVFSTTLFEAMYLGAKLIVIDLTGVEYMEEVLKRKEALLVKTPEDFARSYREAPVSNADYYYSEKAIP